MEFIKVFYTNSSSDYFQALIIFVVSILILYIFKKFIIRVIVRWSTKTSNKLDDAIIRVIKSIKWPFYVLFPFYIASINLVLPVALEKTLYYIFWPITLYYIIQIVHNTIVFILEENAKAKGRNANIVTIFSILIKAILWFIGIAWMLSNLGYDITSLIAGMGIGGIAIALAVQSVLSDIFSAFSIYLDRPFEVGDIIKVGADMGTVERIGMKSTRIKTLQGEELVISNKELTSVRIQNFKKLKIRRVQFSFGVEYSTPTEKLDKISGIMDNICKNIELVEFDRVNLIELSNDNLKYEVVYHVNSREYTDYVNSQQEINIQLLKAFEKEGIKFAFPTQTVRLSESRTA